VVSRIEIQQKFEFLEFVLALQLCNPDEPEGSDLEPSILKISADAQ